MLITTRPSTKSILPQSAITTTFNLGRINRQQTKAIIRDLCGGKNLPEEVLQQIITQTDGVPLFVEEICRTLLESGALREGENDYEMIGTLESLDIPATLQDSLMARLDRLQQAKEVAQIASCIGREFSKTLLASVSSQNEEVVTSALDELIEAQVLVQRGGAESEEYQFKHALLRDAAYESLLKTRRQEFHKIITQKLLKPGSVAPEIVAHHAIHSGLYDTAIDYLYRAGRAANSSSAFKEAISHLQKGLTIIEKQDAGEHRDKTESEFNLLLGAIKISSYGYGSPEVYTHFEHALKLNPDVGDTMHFMALHGMWWNKFVADSTQQGAQHGPTAT